MANSEVNIVTSWEIQEHLIQKLLKDPDLLKSFPAPFTIRKEDPRRIELQKDIELALVPVAESDDDDGIATRGGQAVEIVYTFAAIVYVRGKRLDDLTMQTSGRLTAIVRRALRKHRTDGIGNNPYWMYLEFKKNCTIYHSTGSFRQSVTFFLLHQKVRP